MRPLIPAEARHRFHPRTPWLFFHRDHPLKHERWKKAKRLNEDHETFADQVDRWADVLDLPDDNEDFNS